jgi:Squalene-hopene cyclase C-terminal domain
MATSTDLRSAIDEVQEQLPGEEIYADEAGGYVGGIENRVGALPWWVISAVVHSVLFLLAALITVSVPAGKQDNIIIRSTMVKKDPPKYDPMKKRDVFKQPHEVISKEAVTTDKPLVVHEDVEVSDHFETDDNMDSATAAGNEDAISDIPLGGTGSTGSMGVGSSGGLAGAFGYRGGGGRKRCVKRFGGSEATESAVEAALRWLARHQEKDGGWKKGLDGAKGKASCTAMTGLATLAFLGAGYTHKTGRFRDNVKRAVKYLVGSQKDDGRLAGANGGYVYHGHIGYVHGMGSMALVEAYGMTKDYDLQVPAQKTVDYSVNIHQNPGGGWRYKAKSVGDISVTGWFIMQLKSAKAAGLKVPASAYAGGMAFVETLLGKNGNSVYETGQIRWKNGGLHKNNSLAGRRPAISMVCRLFMGVPRDDELIKLSSRWPAASTPTWEQKDFYYWYYATLAMFQTGGENWKVWNKDLKPTLIDNQRKGGPMDGSVNDVDGSWDYTGDPYGGEKGHGKAGRVYTTALGALCLEVYYRYLPMYGK